MLFISVGDNLYTHKSPLVCCVSFHVKMMHMETAKEEWVLQMSKIEAEAFPADEAADFDGMSSRQKEAGEYFQTFLGADGEIVGYVNGTLCNGDEITHESMEEHVKGGTTLVIHSVTIKDGHRRKGHATQMLKSYVKKLTEEKIYNNVKLALLLCKANLIKFYVSCGFSVNMVSPVVHGADNWFELSLDLIKARQIEQYTVDSFSDRPFSGNPAAVVFLPVEGTGETILIGV